MKTYHLVLAFLAALDAAKAAPVTPDNSVDNWDLPPTWVPPGGRETTEHDNTVTKQEPGEKTDKSVDYVDDFPDWWPG